MRAIAAAALLLTAGCATAPNFNSLPAVEVTAVGETEPVGTAAQDAADDPAIWRNEANPEASLIVATDKKAGLYVYGLDGRRRAFAPVGLLNNVDLVPDANGAVVVGSDRNDIANARLQMFRLLGATGELQPIGTAPGGQGEAYGVCLWRDGAALYAFSVLKEGLIHQVRLDHAAGTGEMVRTMRLGSQTEGCVVDPRTRTLYVGEEGVGIWRFAADSGAPVEGTLVARADGRFLVPDVEGLALAPAGADGGYLVASSQGDNAYALYRLPDMAPAGRFRVAAGAFGSTEETDGIELALGAFGDRFPQGLLVVQDGENAPHAQNFKLISWADVLQAVESAPQPPL